MGTWGRRKGGQRAPCCCRSAGAVWLQLLQPWSRIVFLPPPPPPTPCVVSVSLRGSRGRTCLLVALTARLRLCAAWGAREAFGGLWGGSWGGVGAAGRPHFVRWGVRNWSRCEPPCAAGGSRGRVAEMRCGSPSTAASLCGPHLKIHMVLLGTAPPRNGLTPCSAYCRTPPCCGVRGAAPYGAPGADVPPLRCRAPLPPPEALPTPQAQPQRCTQCPHIPLPHSICAPRTALIPPP